MQRVTTSFSNRYATGLSIVVMALACSQVVAQAWERPEFNVWRLEEPEWTPDEETLSRAASELEAAYLSPLSNQLFSDQKPAWSDYTLFYQGRISEDNRIIRVIGNCNAQFVIVEDIVTEYVIMTADGGRCIFHATYNADSNEVTEFRFSRIRQAAP